MGKETKDSPKAIQIQPWVEEKYMQGEGLQRVAKLGNVIN